MEIPISYFVFKIRLIRLGFSFKKLKILYLNPQPTDSQSGVTTITPGESAVSGRHREAFFQSCLTDSSLIHLILLIQLIQYKIGKNTNVIFGKCKEDSIVPITHE